MRLDFLEIAGFRGFTDQARFDLDANAIILIGSNGQGKTSFFDAILWAFTGDIPRLTDLPKSIISRYSQSGQATVTVGMKNGENSFSVTRTADESQERFIFRDQAGTTHEMDASVRFITELWPDAKFATDQLSALGTALTRSVYLQQDRIRDFLEADSDAERFEAVSNLIGVGRITELQFSLTNSRSAWSKALNSIRGDLGGKIRELEQLKSELNRYGDAPNTSPADLSAWSEWWSRANRFIAQAAEPEVDSPNAADALDMAVRSIDVSLRSETRKHSVLTQLAEQWDSLMPIDREKDKQTLVNLTDKNEECRDLINTLAKQIRDAQELTAKRRELLVREQESFKERQALARLALRHLGERCPVCEQTIDADHVSEHLKRIVAKDHTNTDENDGSEALQSLLDQRTDLESKRAELSLQMSTLESILHDHELRFEVATNDLVEAGLSTEFLTKPKEDVDKSVNTSAQTIRQLLELKSLGEQLALVFARLVDNSRRRHLEEKILDLRKTIDKLRNKVESEERTSIMTSKLIDKLRTAEQTYVAKCISDLHPLLNRIYSRMDPHPSFRDVRMIANLYRGKGRLDAAVLDKFRHIEDSSPTNVLSSSQINVFALSIFLSLNLGISSLPLSTIMLDDPVQGLDDINLLGLVDLLRRAKNHRQIILSTHDRTFCSLLEKKLRPVKSSERTLSISFEGWNRNGPTIKRREVPADSGNLRLVA